MREVVVRPMETMEEYVQAEQIQLDAWNMGDREVIPAHALHAMQHNGAALLGAFDADRMVGFALGILGTVEDTHNRPDQVAAARLKMFSVIAGVLPDYQKSGVGYQLKMGQREFALRIGIRLITWTYDPLESLNARFNIGKLGAVCQTYLRNFHGEMGGINAGLPTDRFEVEWWVTSNRVQARAAQQWRPLKFDSLLGGGAIVVNEATFDAAGLPVPPPNYISHPSNLMLVEIPANMQAIKHADQALAQRWRFHTRDVFEQLFASGFIVTDYVAYQDASGHDRSYYLLAHQDG